MQNKMRSPLTQICLDRNIPPYTYWQQELYRITTLLQVHDKKTGFSNSNDNGTYTKSFDALLDNPYNPASPLTVTDILDDALNCDLLTQDQHNILTEYVDEYHSENPDNPNHINLSEDDANDGADPDDWPDDELYPRS